MAQGEYVIFVDSDDFLLPDVLTQIRKQLKKYKPDVLLLDAICVDEDGKRIENPQFVFQHAGLTSDKQYVGEDAISYQLEAGVLQTTVWLGVYRRNFLTENQLWFRKRLLHEDELWSPMVMIEAASIVYEPMNYYAYRMRTDSIMHSSENQRKNIASMIYVYSHVGKLYEWRIENQQLLTKLKDDIARRYLHVIGKWKFPEYPELMKRVNRLEILAYSKTMKNRLRAIVLLINSKLYLKIYISMKKNR